MARYPHQEVRSVHELIEAVHRSTESWNCEGHIRPWFRGQADAGEPPLPSVLRISNTSRRVLRYDEFHMTTLFRLKAPAFGQVPDTSRLDQWLFLMQHCGLPTRLLDWTENPLAACFFAASRASESEKLRERYSDRTYMAVWVLHPIMLNVLSDRRWNDFLNTWTQGPCLENFKIAFGTAGRDKIPQPEGGYHTFQPTQLPIAVQPSTVAARVAVQRSCFTVHGTDPRDFEALFLGKRGSRRYLKKFVLRRSRAKELVGQLEQLGVSDSTLYPDFDGLAREMKRRFLLKPVDRRGSTTLKLG